MQSVTPYLLYEDCDAALDFLARAFGFEEVLRYTGEQGYVNHAEMKVGREGRIYMGDPGDHYKSPKNLGQETCGIYVEVVGDTAVALAPVSPAEATALLDELRIAPLLGRPALAGIISRFSHLLVDLPELAEIEINPLMTSPDGAIAMDARARLGV